MIFLTIGTYPLQFDRLVKAVDALVAKRVIVEEVYAQIGLCKFEPRHFKYTDMMRKDQFDSYFKRASAVIGHVGMGTITMALDYGKPLLVMPRLRLYNEHVNDHQLATARKFEELGHVLVAYTADELPAKIRQLKSFTPVPRVHQADKVAQRIAEFLDGLCS